MDKDETDVLTYFEEETGPPLTKSFYVAVVIVGCCFLGMFIACVAGWAIQSSDIPDDLQYDAIATYYTDAECTIATYQIGPCWEGEGEGYEGFYWGFSCDDALVIHEAWCGPINDVCNRTECRTPMSFAEEANLCLADKGYYYKWTCMQRQENKF